MHRRKLLQLIDVYRQGHADEAACIQRFRQFVESEADCFQNHCWSGHVTGSAWVVNPAGDAVLLTHHRKLGKWLQLGGHSDGNPDSTMVATREAEEESGLGVQLLDSAVFDLDIHEIPARKGDPAHFHFDVRYAFQALQDTFRVSEESNALAWVPIRQLTDYTDEESILRMQRKWLTRSG
jgi:8-oxo-dGTP pyrophosphatase MutT (NUDIX family)